MLREGEGIGAGISTGFGLEVEQVRKKTLEILHEAQQKASEVFLLWHTAGPDSASHCWPQCLHL
jgi:hypothetical protein